MKELKPCPFCGSEAKIYDRYYENHYFHVSYVLCTHCAARGSQHVSLNPELDKLDDPYNSAINSWNSYESD